MNRFFSLLLILAILFSLCPRHAERPGCSTGSWPPLWSAV